MELENSREDTLVKRSSNSGIQEIRSACWQHLGGDYNGGGRLFEKILALGWRVAKGNGGGLGGGEAYGGGDEGGELVVDGARSRC
ncbi:hypothetical protein TIFTF001_023134 [Ficus carica]|uniref:Uncharacterized protein n=1 Tax=Ficus carica TaxID=3494 RepID=A0AA88AN02_FICCA|nr:hypothetical protein TIFTF001_023134 [Ficus carica]